MCSSDLQSISETLVLDDAVATSSITFPQNWNKKVISINPDMVSGSSDFANFAVLVKLTNDVNLSTTSVGSDGSGIRFTNDGSTLLDYEIESYSGDANSGTLVAWVEVPTLDYDDVTYLYVHYGQSVTIDQQDAQGTWDSDYRGVWHLADTDVASNTSIDESTSNNSDGTAIGLEDNDGVAGKIGGALDFDKDEDGSAERVQVGEALFAADTNQFTISVWVNPDLLDKYRSFVGYQGSDTSPYDRSPTMWVTSSSTMRTDVTQDNSGTKTTKVKDVNNMFTVDEWTLVTWTRDGTTSTFYKNGVQVTTGTAPANGQLLVNNYYQFGWDGRATDYFDGTLDEIRISHTARSSDYISTDYNNQNTGTWNAGDATLTSDYFTCEGVCLYESLSLSDSTARSIGVNIDESLEFSDAVVKTASVGLSEDLVFSDSTAKSTIVRIDEDVQFTDAVSVGKSITKSLAESVGFTVTTAKSVEKPVEIGRAHV